MAVSRSNSYVFLLVTLFSLSQYATRYFVLSTTPPNNNNPPPSTSPSIFPTGISSSITSEDHDDAADNALPMRIDYLVNDNNEAPSAKNTNAAVEILPPPPPPFPPTQSSKSISKASSSSSSSSSLQSSVSFLYELYEHEIYNAKTNSWTSRRFTQSPITGGGGRDSTSLNPQDCTPPRNYLFDGEWKIDMASETLDGFGWEYYVGRYDGLGRRRRRWVRSLIRVSSSSSSSSSSSLNSAVSTSNKQGANNDAKKTKKSTKVKASTKTKRRRTYQPNYYVLQAIREQYNFKGFGWSFYKSLIYAKSVGAAFRIPLSANFDSYDQYLAAPYISSSTYFGYPWMVAILLNASLPVEAVKWLIGGIIWKVQWSLAVVSALIRGVAETLIWIICWPWRLWTSITLRMMRILAWRKKQESKEEEKSLPIDDIVIDDGADEGATSSNGIIQHDESTNVTIETHIEINNSSSSAFDKTNENNELSAVSATAIVDNSPRGGASITSQASPFRKKHLTISGNEIPTFHRTTNIEYSTSIQERIGVSISWRISQERGYEYRCNFFFSCLPTPVFWGQLEEERRKRMEIMRRVMSVVWGGKKNDPSSASNVGTKEISNTEGNDENSRRLESKSSFSSGSRSKSKTKPSPLSTFLSDHSSSLGLSGGWPLPVHPFFNVSLMLSLSQFYYGWLFRSIRSLFELPSPKKLLGQNDTISSTDNDKLSGGNEKLVSFALKEKVPKEEMDQLTRAQET